MAGAAHSKILNQFSNQPVTFESNQNRRIQFRIEASQVPTNFNNVHHHVYFCPDLDGNYSVDLDPFDCHNDIKALTTPTACSEVNPEWLWLMMCICI